MPTLQYIVDAKCIGSKSTYGNSVSVIKLEAIPLEKSGFRGVLHQIECNWQGKAMSL